MQAEPGQRIIERDQLREQIRQTIEGARIYQSEAQAQGVATAQAPPHWDPADMPVRVQETAIAFFIMLAVIIIGLPIARAFGRRIDRVGVNPRIPAEVSSQLVSLNQAVESIAIEVERISEGQRFTTKLLSEQRTLPPANGVS